MWNGMMANCGWGWMGIGAIGSVLLALLAVAGIVLLVQRFWTRPSSGSTAFDILRERYARGEIDRNEFEQKRQDMGA